MSTSTQSKPAGAVDQLPLRTKLAYGLGDAGCNMSWTLVGTILMYFYTDVVGISMYAVSALFLISRLWDAINDPMVGALADRTRTKWGVYRPWLLFGSFFLAAANVLTFTTIPNASSSGKFVYALVTYSVLVLAYTAVNIPYGSLLGRLTQNTDDRASASGMRIFFATVFGSLISMLAVPMVSALGGDNPAKGYLLLAVICSALLIPIFMITFASCKEVVKVPETKKEKFKLSSVFAVFKHNTPLVVVSIGMFICGFLTNGRNAVLLYYFNYVAGDAGLMVPYMLVTLPASMVGTFFGPWLSQKIGSKGKTMVLICAALFVSMAAMYFFPPNVNLVMFLILTGIVAIFTTSFAAVSYGMIPDCIEYGQYKNNVRADGMIYSMNSFINKIGITLATSGLSLLLGSVGYIEGGVSQSAGVVKCINLTMTMVPALICLVGAIPYLFYKLDRTRFNQILAELASREQGE